MKRSVKSIQADGDNYLTLAEENSDLSYLVKANAFRKTVWETVQETEDSVKDLNQAIGKLNSKLKNLKRLSARVIAFIILLDFWTKTDYCLFFLSFC